MGNGHIYRYCFVLILALVSIPARAEFRWSDFCQILLKTVTNAKSGSAQPSHLLTSQVPTEEEILKVYQTAYPEAPLSVLQSWLEESRWGPRRSAADILADLRWHTDKFKHVPFYLAKGHLTVEDLIPGLWLQRVLFQNRPSDEAFKELLRYIPFLPPEKQLPMIQEIAGRVSEPSFGLFKYLQEPQQIVAAYEAAVKKRRPYRRSFLDLALLTLLPESEIPPQILAAIDVNWNLALLKNAALRSNHVRLVPNTDCEPAGHCQDMWQTHVSTLLSAAETNDLLDESDQDGPKGQTVAIYLRGDLVGVVKLHGDPSFLALRTVINSKGRLTLVKGGVYWIDKAILDRFESLVYDTDKPYWLSFNLDELPVYPRTFLLNENAVKYGDLSVGLMHQLNVRNNSIRGLSRRGRLPELWRTTLLRLEDVRQKLRFASEQP